MRFYLAGLMVILTGIFCGPVRADETTDYENFIKKNYYLLDNQQFSKITCKVRVPDLDKILAVGRQRLQTLPGKAVIEGGVEDFSLVYDKATGLSFIKPVFEIKASDPGGITNQQNFDQGSEAMKTGLKDQVDGVAQVLTGVFNEYILSNKKKVESFLKTASGAEVTLQKDGMTGQEKYFDASRTTTLSGPGGMTGIEQSQFEKINNSLILSKSTVQAQQAAGKIDASLEISYDQPGGVPFPKSIVDKTSMQLNGVKQEMEVDINLDQCTVE